MATIAATTASACDIARIHEISRPSSESSDRPASSQKRTTGYGDDDHRHAREVLLERDEEPFGDGDPERNLEPVLAQPALTGRRLGGGRRRRGRKRLGYLPFSHRSTVPRWKCDP